MILAYNNKKKKFTFILFFEFKKKSTKNDGWLTGWFSKRNSDVTHKKRPKESMWHAVRIELIYSVVIELAGQTC